MVGGIQGKKAFQIEQKSDKTGKEYMYMHVCVCK